VGSALTVVGLALAAFLVPIAWTPAVAADVALASTPHDAHLKSNRDDLTTPVRESGEVRVIVGLDAPAAGGQASTAGDSARATAVAARQAKFLKKLARHNVRDVKPMRLHDFVAMTIDGAALDALLADDEVASIAVDQPVFPLLHDTPGITGADNAWIAGYRGAGQAIAIIDTGVDKAHPFFTSKVVAEACFSRAVNGGTSYCPGGVAQKIGSGAGAPCSDYGLGCWHGTHVAGIAAGNYGVLSGTTGGIAPSASVIAIQVFQRDCTSGTCKILAYDSDLALALEHVYSLRGTHSIASANMSLGGGAFSAACDNESPAVTSAINSLRDAGIATVAAAGNAGNAGAITFPACISSAISVGSTTKQDAISGFSNSASFLSLLAPGSSITSSVPVAANASGFLSASGTSMATPHVAGAWAVLKSAKTTASVTEVLSALQTGGLPITDSRNGVTKRLIQIGYDGTALGATGTLLGHGNVQPTVAITSPGAGATFTAPATVPITATATDTDGGVAKVEFFNGATKIGESSTSPYSFTWTNVAANSYALTAKATDVLGGTRVSAPVNISVAANATTYQSGAVTTSGAALSG
jgi:subtilisin family serine protease